MLWKTVSGLVAVSLAVVAAADDSGAATFAPAKVHLAVKPSDDSAVEVEAKATLAVEPFDPSVDTNITLAVEPVNANATDSLVATTLTLAPNTEAGPTCSVQAGVDYVGNDLKSVLGAVGDCCGKCQGTSGCKAYTWSDFNGGTCWLKTARGETKQVTGVTSGVVAVSGSQTEPNTDYIGNDVGSALGKDADACFDKCKAVTGCKAFTWSDFNGGTCWLKSARGQTKTVTGVYSAELPVDADGDNSEWNVEQGVDYIGNDLTSVAGKTAADCQPKCAGYAGCRAFTWSDWNGGTCFLKSTRGPTKSEKSVTSAVAKTADVAPGQCSTEQGKDYIGKDIGNAPGADAADCCKQCSVKAGCEAYTWTKWEGGRCWFKSDVTGSNDNADAVSGKVAAGSSTTHVAFKLRSGEIPARSVNLGGWLVCEHWMSKTSPAWNNMPVSVAGSGEYGVMKHLGKEQGTKQFEEHRSSWITEADIKEIASVGLNMVRVPVGFWIVDDIPGVEPTPISSVYARGSLKYLDRLVNEWSVKYNVGIYLSLHAHQGSQNGYDHSAPQEYGKVEWSAWSNNVDNSVRFAKILAARYKDAPGFVGLQLLNEPAGSTNAEVRDQYYLRAYREIRANGNDCIIGISPMLYQQDQWVLRDFMRWPEYTNVWMEWHTYYKWGYENQNEDQIIAAVKTYRKDHFTNWPGNWVHIGEWSLGNGWNEEKFKNTNKLKEFAAAQMEQFTDAHAGWSFWSWHHDDEYLKEADGRNVVSGWNLRQLIRLGVITVPK